MSPQWYKQIDRYFLLTIYIIYNKIIVFLVCFVMNFEVYNDRKIIAILTTPTTPFVCLLVYNDRKIIAILTQNQMPTGKE